MSNQKQSSPKAEISSEELDLIQTDNFSDLSNWVNSCQESIADTPIMPMFLYDFIQIVNGTTLKRILEVPTESE